MCGGGRPSTGSEGASSRSIRFTGGAVGTAGAGEALARFGAGGSVVASASFSLSTVQPSLSCGSSSNQLRTLRPASASGVFGVVGAGVVGLGAAAATGAEAVLRLSPAPLRTSVPPMAAAMFAMRSAELNALTSFFQSSAWKFGPGSVPLPESSSWLPTAAGLSLDATVAPLAWPDLAELKDARMSAELYCLTEPL